MTTRVRMRMTITGEYYADPENFPDDAQTAEAMAAIDGAAAMQWPEDLMEWLDPDTVKIEIKAVPDE